MRLGRRHRGAGAGRRWLAQFSAPRHPRQYLLLPLPPYSPEFNPVENIWAFMRSNYLSHRVFADYDAILKACADAWNALMKLPQTITSIATRTWAQVKI